MGVLADKIRKAIFGSEVRESIAESVEWMEEYLGESGAIPQDNSVTKEKIVNEAVTPDKILEVPARKVVNSLITENDYIGLWNNDTTSQVTITDNNIHFSKISSGNSGLIFKTVKVADFDEDTIYLKMQLKNDKIFNPWVFTSTNKLGFSLGSIAASTEYNDITLSFTKAQLENKGLAEFRIVLVGSDVGEYYIKNLTLNDNKLSRDLMGNIKGIIPDKIVNTRALLSSFTYMWGSSNNNISIVNDQLIYTKNSPGDSGIQALIDLSDITDLDKIFLSFEFMSNSSGFNVNLFTSTGTYKGNLYNLGKNSNFITKTIIIDKGRLSRAGITNNKFIIGFNLHETGTCFRLRNVNISNVANGINVRDSLNKLFSEVTIRTREMLGQATDFSDTNKYIPVSTTGYHYCTPNTFSSGDNILKTLHVYVPSAGNYTFAVGTIDQNNLLVNPVTFTVSLSAGYNVVDMEGKNIEVPYGSMVFMDLSTTNVLYNPTDSTAKYVNTLAQDESNTINSGGYTGMVMHDTSYMLPFSYTLIAKGINQIVQNVQNTIEELISNSNNSSDTTEDEMPELIFIKPDGTKARMIVGSDNALSTLNLVPSKVAFIGNSLTSNTGGIGMCASDQYHDYYYLVSKYLMSKNPNVIIGPRRNVATWESCTTSADRQNWWNTIGTTWVDADTDLVIVQLVDNVNTTENLATFGEDAKTLISNIRTKSPNARVVWVAGWFVDDNKIALIKQACKERGAIFVDITQYNSDPKYKGSLGQVCTAVDGTTWTVTNPGAAAHPGDLGMKKIAETIIKALNF